MNPQTQYIQKRCKFLKLIDTVNKYPGKTRQELIPLSKLSLAVLYREIEEAVKNGFIKAVDYPYYQSKQGAPARSVYYSIVTIDVKPIK